MDATLWGSVLAKIALSEHKILFQGEMWIKKLGVENKVWAASTVRTNSAGTASPAKRDDFHKQYLGRNLHPSTTAGCM